MSTPLSTPQSEILQAKGICKTFSNRRVSNVVLNNVTVSIKEKEYLIVSGQSGSGKTTLLNCIAGLEKPDAGTITVQGNDIYTLTPDERAHFRATRIGIVYQQAHWVGSLTVAQNVGLPLISVGIGHAQAEATARTILKQFDLDGLSDQNPHELSGGEMQRVGIARAIIHNPWLIIADEPTGSLDTHSADQVMAIFSSLNIEQGRTIILVTHNPIYEFYGTHFIEMRNGEVIKDHYNEN